MDSEPNHSRVRVILGRSGKVVCTLKVDSKYSHSLVTMVQHRTRPSSAPWSRKRFKSRMDTTAPGRTSFSNVSTFIREVDHLIEAKLVSNIYPWSWTCIVTGLAYRGLSQVQDAIGFANYWLKNWREILKSITKRSSRNRVIILSTDVKTALYVSLFCLEL